MRPYLAGLLGLLLGIAVGVVGTWRFVRPVRPVLQGAQTVSLGGRQLCGDEVRAVIREELAAFRNQLATPSRPTAGGVPTEVSPEGETALRSGHRLVDAALASHRWSDREAQQLRHLLAKMSEAQKQEVLHRLVPAINRQEIRVHLTGPPF